MATDMKKSLLIIILFFSPALWAADIVIFGDSLSAGYGIDKNNGWVELIKKKLEAIEPKVTIINASISGETAKGGAQRLPLILKQHQPKIIMLELGANDGLRGYPIAGIEQQLASMIEQSQKQNSIVLLTGTHLPPNLGEQYSQAFFDMYEQLATKYNTAYMPFLIGSVVLDEQLMQLDQLHPNAQAQPIIAEDVYQYLQPLIAALAANET